MTASAFSCARLLPANCVVLLFKGLAERVAFGLSSNDALRVFAFLCSLPCLLSNLFKLEVLAVSLYSSSSLPVTAFSLIFLSSQSLKSLSPALRLVQVASPPSKSVSMSSGPVSASNDANDISACASKGCFEELPAVPGVCIDMCG